jgi:hypothetical protein
MEIKIGKNPISGLTWVYCIFGTVRVKVEGFSLYFLNSGHKSEKLADTIRFAQDL